MECTIRLVGVHSGRHPLSWLGDRSNHAFNDHIIKGLLDLFPVLYGYLPPGMLNRGDGMVSPDGIGP